MNITAAGPETPDPTQLDLFHLDCRNAETQKHSADSAIFSLSNEPLIRSPTDDGYQVQPENGKKFELNETQRSFASSLHRKSRELVQKSRDKQNEINDTDENDLAR